VSLADKHLDLEQIELLIGASSAELQHGNQEDVLGPARQHLVGCAECQKLLSDHQDGGRMLIKTRQLTPGGISKDCPSDHTLYELAAGIVDTKRAQQLLGHVSTCDHCAPLLRQAFEDVKDEAEPGEAAFVANLNSASPGWQKKLAHRLSATPRSIKYVPEPVRRKWRLSAVLVGALAAVALAVWIGMTMWVRSSPEQLLVRAFSEKRTVEMRIEGAGYVPLSQERGEIAAGDRMNRPALLKAESETAHALRMSPDDPLWLQARGRTSLLEGDPEGAISVLERARELKPGYASIDIDLASAYFDRGARLERAQDIGKSVEILGRVLGADPANQAAMFNHAIALEHSFLYEQAEGEWQHYLELFSQSAWAPEARERLSTLEEKIRQRREKSEMPLMPAADFAEAVESGDEQAITNIDQRIEGYLELATREWLPVAFGRTRDDAGQSRSAFRASKDLARVLSLRHEDRWLTELMSGGSSSPATAEAMRLVAEAQRKIEVSDEGKALVALREAANLFAASHNLAGEFYVQFQTVYAEQLSHRNEQCAIGAKRLAQLPELSAFSWLRVQVDLESAICASTSDDRAVRLARNAVGLAAKHSYPVLKSRATKTLSGIEWAVGDSEGAWNTVAGGMQEYWISDLPRLRGYNLLTDLDFLAEDGQQSFLQAAVLKEAVPMIQDDPDTVMRAFECGRLARALQRTGDLAGAERAFGDMARLFGATPESDRSRNLAAEAEIGLSEIEVERGGSGRAVRRLEAIRPLIEHAGDDDLALEFFKAYGFALTSAGDKRSAETALGAAMKLAEDGLRLVHDARDRLRWSRRNEQLYRSMVSFKFQTRPVEAFRYWESFKGASLLIERRHDSVAVLPLGTEELRIPADVVGDDTALVSYFVSSEGLGIWVADSKGTQSRWTNTTQREVGILARHFSEHCSDPSSNLELVRQEGAELYRKILLPIEPLVRGRHLLVFEPDGDLKQVPFGALVDNAGNYLIDRYAFAVSPGLLYQSESRPWIGISKITRALVIGSPSGQSLSSLPDSEHEARMVAALFEKPRLFVKQEATYESVAKELPVAEVFHFAGHAIANRSSAGMMLAETGLFDTSRLRRLQARRTQLVVLSACSTADGRSGLFDDEDSLVREFIGVGAPEVVASGWAVDSSATSELMTEFYRGVFSGRRVSEALAQAAASVRARREYAHPFYWAGFSVFGRG
jgi:CHAT domain-containing protein/tetratricopeptide (TPR) repeat protein